MAIHSPSEMLDITQALAPAAVNDTATTGALFRDIRPFRKMLVICSVGAMASGSATVKPYQNTAASSGSPKAIGSRMATLDAANEVALFEIDPLELDFDNGYYFVGCYIDPPAVATGLVGYVIGVEPLHAPVSQPNVAEIG